ncbi:VanZ family protein [Vallitalea pronyensis]|uniref:VanZ family protein n=1 Tax=Vallitalea pronyensis TaxID=1348613 RepID=A0A8J8MMD7_9FIRM|nr:VanZ family protein [Vallitalea pronyensis]QUI24410.1 VanZ family protein [Vallitalea pronyensis]
MRTKDSNMKHKVFLLIGYILFALYLMLLIDLLFFDGRSGGVKDYNLVPFRTIKNYIKYRHVIMNVSITNIVGNILAFIPLGFFVPTLWRWARWMIITTIFCGLMSFIVEITQYRYSVGRFDVDDIILNTLGGLIGYMVYKLCRLFYTCFLKGT